MSRFLVETAGSLLKLPVPEGVETASSLLKPHFPLVSSFRNKEKRRKLANYLSMQLASDTTISHATTLWLKQPILFSVYLHVSLLSRIYIVLLNVKCSV